MRFMTSGGGGRDEGAEENGECRPTSGSYGVCLKAGTDDNFFLSFTFYHVML